MKRDAEPEVRCTNCNDIIDASHNPKNCQKCGEPFAGYKKVKTPPFISTPGMAFLIAIISVILAIVIIINIGAWIGIKESMIPKICIPGFVALIFLTGITLFRFLRNLDENE